MKIGDAIEKVTKAVGIDPCAECKERKEHYNKIQEDVKQTLLRLIRGKHK